MAALSKFAPTVTTIVVDNASADGTMDRVRAKGNVRVIANDKNLGFAAGLNKGVRATGDSEFILVLNPDVELLTAVD